MNKGSPGVGPEHHSWKGGTTQRGRRWEILSGCIRRRDEHTCLVCGLIYSNSDYERRFHVHHITPVEDVPAGVDPHAPANLVTVCPTCHKRLEDESVRCQLELADVDQRGELLFSPEGRENISEFLDDVLPDWRRRLSLKNSEPYLRTMPGEKITHYIDRRLQEDSDG